MLRHDWAVTSQPCNEDHPIFREPNPRPGRPIRTWSAIQPSYPAGKIKVVMLANFTAYWPGELITFVISPIVLYLTYRLGRFLKHWIAYISEWFLWLITRGLTTSLAGRLSLYRYARSRLSDDSTRFLQVPGSPHAPLDVDKVFVPLTLDQGGHRGSSYTDSTILRAGNRLLIVGDPGSGKSSLIKRIFRANCRLAERTPKKSRLPIQLELKALNPPNGIVDDQSAGEWLLGELRHRVADVEGYEMGQLFDSYSATNGLIILLDGLDEVSGDNYPAVAAALRGLSRLLSARGDHNAVVITMRIQFHRQVLHELVKDYPQTLSIRNFNPNEIYTFLTRWPFQDEQKNRNVARIYADLTDRPTLREMCSNPLVLAMYVANDQTSTEAEIPETRTEFYRAVVKELLVLRRRRQQLTTTRSTSLREQREALLGELAFANLVNGNEAANSLSWATAIEVGGRVWCCESEEAETRLRELAKETGIISEERPGETFRFIHLTFCEFLAAVECVGGSKGSWSHLLDAHRTFVESGEVSLNSRLIEVIPFALAMLPPRDRTKALAEVAALRDSQILGRCFLETQLYDNQEWKAYIESESSYLAIGAVVERNETWLHRLRLFNVVINDARVWFMHIAKRPISPKINSVLSKIVTRNQHALVEVFSSYAKQDAAGAFRLADAVGVDMLTEHSQALLNSCQEPAFLALAMERAANDPEKRITWVQLMSEAALIFASVARYLESVPAPDYGNSEIERTKFPFVKRLMNEESFYGWCFGLARSNRVSINSRFVVLALVSSVWTRYAKTRRKLLIFLLPGAVCTAALLFGLVNLLPGGQQANVSLSEELLVIGAVLAVAGMVNLTMTVSLALTLYIPRLYRALLNLPSDVRNRDSRKFLLDVGCAAGRFFVSSEQAVLERLVVIRSDMGGDVQWQRVLLRRERRNSRHRRT